jgi:hypothetical protein
MGLDQEANKRIEYIQKRQELLASAVSDAQSAFYASILKQIDKIAKNPAELDVLFYKFNRGEYMVLMNLFALDVRGIGRVNGEYFEAIADGRLWKDYSATKAEINDKLLQRFGLTERGALIEDGFFDLFVRDTSIQQQAKKAAYQLQYSGKGPKEFATTLQAIIEGEPGQSGAYEKHFNRYVYDTYQQADAEVQELYAKKLDLQAALYSGGTVRDSRPFCKARNGFVWLRSEIASWNQLDWAGKIKEGTVEVNRVGYNCRHHLSYITNKMALQRRSDLYIDEKGNLQIKS